MNFADYLLIFASACKATLERVEVSEHRARLGHLDAIDRDLAELRENSDAYGDLILKLLEDRDSHRDALRTAERTLRNLAARLAATEAAVFGKNAAPRADTRANTRADARVNADPERPSTDSPRTDRFVEPAPKPASIADRIQVAVADFQAAHPDWATTLAKGVQRVHDRVEEHPTADRGQLIFALLDQLFGDVVADAPIPKDQPRPTTPAPAPTPPADPTAFFSSDLFTATRSALGEAVATLRDAGLSSESARAWFIAGNWAKPRQATEAHRAARRLLNTVTREFGRRGTDDLRRVVDVYTIDPLWTNLWDPPTNVTPIRRAAES